MGAHPDSVVHKFSVADLLTTIPPGKAWEGKQVRWLSGEEEGLDLAALQQP